MKTKRKSCSTKIKFPRLHPDMPGYYKATDKVFAKCIGMHRPKCRDAAGSPDIIQANGHDICNYVAKYNMANFQIQAIMKLDGRLDPDKLARAVRLSVDAEPVLGCRFIQSDPPYWKRFDDMDHMRFCSIEETDHPDEAVRRFLESPMDMDNGPVVRVKLIRSGTHDTLGVKINHACSDAAGAREYIELLSDIYSRIDHEEGDFVPNPSIRSRRDHVRLFSALRENPAPAWSPLKQIAMPTWRFPWKNCRIGATRFVALRLPCGHLDRMKSYGKARGATINDLILTAIYRTLFEISRPVYGVPMDIPITIDLRKYLPDHKAQAIRNLSGGTVIRMARKAHESFEETLSRVMPLTGEIKNGRPSTKNMIWAEYIERMNFHQICAYFKAVSQMIEFASQSPFYVVDKCCPILSNFGLISKSFIKFGENTVTDAYIIPPVVRAPGILLVASTYNGIITFAVGYYKPSVRRTDMEGLLKRIRDELVEGCGQ